MDVGYLVNSGSQVRFLPLPKGCVAQLVEQECRKTFPTPQLVLT